MNNQTVYFKEIQEKIIETLSTANEEVLIAVAWFTDKKIIETLDNLSERGVSISIIIYDDKINNKDLFKNLYYKKADIRNSKKLMHNKFCIIDSEIVINGSYNWTYNAHTNDENIQITKFNNDLADTFKEQFYKLQIKCNHLHNHFKYSIANIENEELLFDDYYQKNLRDNKTPFFHKIKESDLNNSLREGYYCISNDNVKYNFFKLIYYIGKGYKIDDLEVILNQNIPKPICYFKIYKDTNKSNYFNEEKVLVVENVYYLQTSKYYPYKKTESNTILKKFIYFINNKGESISEKIKINKILNNDYFQISSNSICDSNLNIIEFNLNFISKFVDEIGIICIEDNKYALYSFEGKKILKNSYDNYKVSEDNKTIDLIEYPQLQVGPFSIIKNYNSSHFSFAYSPYKVCNINKDKIISTKYQSNHGEAPKHIYCSDFDYKYSDFISELKKRINENKYSNLTLNQFYELRERFNQHSLKHNNNLFEYLSEEEYKKRVYEIENKKSCFIATMVYKDIEHPKVEALRQFRDKVLCNYYLGRIFIKYYYRYSPYFVSKLKNKKNTNTFIRKLLDIIIKIIK